METLLPSGTKRKRHTIPLQIKNAIIEDSATESNSNLAKKYCVGESTIRGILKDKAKILKAIEMGSGAKRANLRGAKFAELEETLLKWVIYAKKQGVIIKGGILKEKASEIAQFLNIEDFKASQGWVSKFKERHIMFFKDSDSTDSDTVVDQESFVEDWRNSMMEKRNFENLLSSLAGNEFNFDFINSTLFSGQGFKDSESGNDGNKDEGEKDSEENEGFGGEAMSLIQLLQQQSTSTAPESTVDFEGQREDSRDRNEDSESHGNIFEALFRDCKVEIKDFKAKGGDSKAKLKVSEANEGNSEAQINNADARESTEDCDLNILNFLQQQSASEVQVNIKAKESTDQIKKSLEKPTSSMSESPEKSEEVSLESAYKSFRIVRKYLEKKAPSELLGVCAKFDEFFGEQLKKRLMK